MAEWRPYALVTPESTAGCHPCILAKEVGLGEARRGDQVRMLSSELGSVTQTPRQVTPDVPGKDGD